MIKFFKIFILFITIGIFNFILSILYLSFLKLPGGETGMLPLLILYYSLFTIAISSVLFIIIELNYKLSPQKYIWIYQVIYFLVLVINKTDPFENRYGGIINNWNLWPYLISIIASICFVVLYYIYKTKKTKEKNYR